MPTTDPAAPGTATSPALDELRRPIRDYAPEDSAGRAFRTGMLGLADLFEELSHEEDPGALEGEVLWSALHGFPGLVASGPSSGELVDLTVGGRLLEGEDADTLYTLGCIQKLLRGFEPPGFGAALMRDALLAIYRLIAILVVFGDQQGIDRCFDLLATAERLADRLAGRI